MTIDPQMLGAVRHYLRGTSTVAYNIHDEIQMGRSFDYAYEDESGSRRTLGDDIDEVQRHFSRRCRNMLRDPVPKKYAHIKDYHLTSADRKFLNRLFTRARNSSWRNSEEVRGLCSAIDEYAPHEGFGTSAF